MIKLRALRWENPSRLSEWANVSARVSKRWKKEAEGLKKEMRGWKERSM